MKKVTALIVFVGLCLITQTVFSSEMVTLLGTVSENFQLITDSGEIYEIAENPQREALIEFVGKRVEVEGQISNSDDNVIIKISSFIVLDNTSN